MNVQLGHLSLVPSAEQSTPAPGAPSTAPAAAPAQPPVRADVTPGTPPPEVADEVGAAALRVEQLRDADRELHFEKDEKSGRIVVQVRDLDGNVVRTIPPSQALAIMAGDAEP